MKLETSAIKLKVYSFLVDDSRQHKKAKDVNKNAAARVNLSKYKDILLNSKCLKHSINIIQSQNYKEKTIQNQQNQNQQNLFIMF